jgi:hypothetical protein
MIRNGAVFVLISSAAAHAGAIVSLVPTAPINGIAYQPDEVVNVGVFAQLTAGTPTVPNATNSVRVRLMQFDLSDTSPELLAGIAPVGHHPLQETQPNAGPIPFWDYSSTTVCAGDETGCGTNYFVDGELPGIIPNFFNTTYTALTSSGSLMVTLNQTTPKRVGELNVTMPNIQGDYVLDLLNADETDPNLGAELRWGFGTAADPTDPTSPLRANTGGITSDRLIFGVIGSTVPDCNGNGIPDPEEDCNANGLPDSCETSCEGSVCGCIGPYEGEYEGASVGTIVSSLYCNGQLDYLFTTSYGPILFQTTAAMNEQGVITGNGQKIKVDGQFDFESCTASGTWNLFGGAPGTWTTHLTRECLPDCNGNSVPDSCDIRDALSPDCNGNQVPDECDLALGASFDCNHNDIPDECEDPPVFAITFTDPIAGIVDVRQDRSITGQTAQGFDRVRMRFTCEPYDAATGEPFTTESFMVTSTSGIAPLVFTINEVAEPNTFDIILSDPIPPGAWTTITAIVESPDGVPIDPTANSVTLGFLPGDVNGTRTSTPSDILDLIDHLNGVRIPPLLPRQCDIDRSGQCAPPDIVRLIDLLNGVNTTRPWLGVSLPPAP